MRSTSTQVCPILRACIQGFPRVNYQGSFVSSSELFHARMKNTPCSCSSTAFVAAGKNCCYSPPWLSLPNPSRQITFCNGPFRGLVMIHASNECFTVQVSGYALRSYHLLRSHVMTSHAIAEALLCTLSMFSNKRSAAEMTILDDRIWDFNFLHVSI